MRQKTTKDPSLQSDLEMLVEPFTRGDSESPLCWIGKSTRTLAKALNGQGHEVSRGLVASLLREMDYSLQANKKRDEGTKDHPDRDAQFRYIDSRLMTFQRQQQPVLSVDANRCENVGNYKNAVRSYRKK